MWIRQGNDGLVFQDFSRIPLALLLLSWRPDSIPRFSQLYIWIPEEEGSSPGRREVSWLPGSEFSASVFISFGGKPPLSGRFRTLDSAVLVAGGGGRGVKGEFMVHEEGLDLFELWQKARMESQK